MTDHLCSIMKRMRPGLKGIRWLTISLVATSGAAQGEPQLEEFVGGVAAMPPKEAVEKVLPMARKDWDAVVGALVRTSRGDDPAAKATDHVLRVIFERTELALGAPHYGVQWGFFLHEDEEGNLQALPYAERLFDGPARAAGLRRGETALAIDDISLHRPDAPNFLRRYLRMSQPGSTVELTLRTSSIGKNPGALWTDKKAKVRRLGIKLGPARTKPERNARPGEFEAWKATFLTPHTLKN